MKSAAPLLLLCLIAAGCAMFGSWRSIPAPGGCDRCHTLEISGDWKVTVAPVALTGEDGKPQWQRPDSLLPGGTSSQLEQKMLEEGACFHCHREPDLQHREFKGSYHHR